ncbi:hypothetical protein [Vibrio mangrovi]|uniref:ApeI dehydratase-like domain-containing protein n=1 Tax=Vibrio mangrovi TaxID=474394 RepID=A0A1Y6IXN4_9VIBR|nr:hypothetical protein [Vibrio mangrovi]MDW6002909.1 hypothetical protein [Vibrio mangrovi]SMS02398.1 hypothetical protein VIM7927_03720 [Vibrio mangrovi]
MNSGFLTICDDNVIEIDDNLYQSHLKLSNYKFSSKENLFSTVLEGIHQFAAKVSDILEQSDDSYPPLPIQIDEFWMKSDEQSIRNVLLLSGSVESVTTFFVVKGKIYDLKDRLIGGFQIKTARIPYVADTETKRELPHALDDPKIFSFKPISQSGENTIELPFSFDEQSFLAYEHFPGAPILPASQIIGLAKQACADHFNVQVNRVGRSSFIQPVQSGSIYMLEMTHLQGDKVKFVVSSEDKVHTRGVMSISESTDN